MYIYIYLLSSYRAIPTLDETSWIPSGKYTFGTDEDEVEHPLRYLANQTKIQVNSIYLFVIKILREIQSYCVVWCRPSTFVRVPSIQMKPRNLSIAILFYSSASNAVFKLCFMMCLLEPNISFEFVPTPIPHPSTTTYAQPCPPIAWHVPPMLLKLHPTHAHPCNSNCAHVLKNCNIINNITINIAPMPTQNLWAWVWGTQCRALLSMLWGQSPSFHTSSQSKVWRAKLDPHIT